MIRRDAGIVPNSPPRIFKRDVSRTFKLWLKMKGSRNIVWKCERLTTLFVSGRTLTIFFSAMPHVIQYLLKGNRIVQKYKFNIKCLDLFCKDSCDIRCFCPQKKEREREKARKKARMC